MTRTVWKFGCRWSEKGDAGTSIFEDVFEKYSVAFAATPEVFRMVEGDLVAIADGYTIIAIGEACTPPSQMARIKSAKEPTSEDWQEFFVRADVYGCRVHYYPLKKEEQISYKKMGMFVHASQIEAEVNKLFNTKKAQEEAKNSQEQTSDYGEHQS